MRNITQCVSARSVSALLIAASPLAIFSPAYAQSDAVAESESVESSRTSGNEVITVTAQRRDESAQDVPISLQAYSSESLKRFSVDSTDDLTGLISSFVALPSAARPSLFLRGVGTNSSNTTPAVQTFVDGIYYPFGQSTDFVNVASVEVLKGPQGTLFGRNATGGVIQVTTKPPSEVFGARFEVGYGNYDTFTTSGYITGGLSDGVAIDLALRYHDQNDGYGVNVFNGEDVFLTRRFTARSRIKFDFSDATSVTLGGDYSRLRGTAGTNVAPAAGYDELFVAGQLRHRGDFYPGDFDVNSNLHPFWISKEWGVNAKLESEFNDLTFRSISSYRRSGEDINIDFDGGPANAVNLGITRDPRTAFTQELQLLSASSGPLEWTVGAFYYWSNWHSDPFQLCVGGANLNTPGCGPVAIAEDFTDSIAAYAQGTYEFSPGTRLTLGGRYTHEKRRTDGYVTAGGNEIPGRRGSLSQTFNEPTWRVALDHRFSPEALVYASVSRGFNSGFYNQANFGGFANEMQNRPVLPEFLTVYEVGTKTDFLDRRLRVNLSGFLYKYNNLQQQIYDQGAVVTINAGSAEIKGIDFEVVARPVDSLTLSVTGAYLDAKYTRYPLAPNYVRQPNGSIIAVGNLDAAGRRIVNAPKWSWTATAVHVLPTSIGEFATSAALNYRGTAYIDPVNNFELPSRHVLNVSERWTSQDERYFVSLWVENLLDERYDYGINILTPAGLVGNTAPPRTYGLTLGFQY